MPTQETEHREEFRIVPLADLHESPTNPRQHFSEKGMQELVRSVRDQGVLVPLVVTPLNGDGELEIVCGARRFRAAQEAKLEEVPVRVLQLTSEEVLEIQVIENLQREDVHPLDQAEGYKRLMRTGRYDVAALAGKVAKSPTYIYQRLKLCDLIGPAKKAFWKEKISLGHAQLIARLQPKDQKAALSECTRWDGVTVSSLAEWINRHILLDLSKAAFPTDDASLVRSAGPCTTCLKRLANSPSLFPEIKEKDTCTDPACFEGKMEALLQRRMQEHKKAEGGPLVPVSTEYGGYYNQKLPKGTLQRSEYARLNKKAEHCPHTKSAIVVNGSDFAAMFPICTDKKCRVHHASTEWDAGWKKKQRQEREARKEKAELELRIRSATLQAMEQEGFPRVAVNSLLADMLVGELWHEFRQQACKELEIQVPKGEYGGRDYQAALRSHASSLTTENDLVRFLVHLALIRKTDGALRKVAKSSGVNLRKIAAKFRGEKAAKAAKKKAKKKPASKKTAPRAGRKNTRRTGKAAGAERRGKAKKAAAAPA